MPREESYTIAEPGAGDMTDGSVDYYPMEWEIVGRDSLSAARSVRAGRSAADETDAAPAARTETTPRCGGSRPQQNGAGGETVNE